MVRILGAVAVVVLLAGVAAAYVGGRSDDERDECSEVVALADTMAPGIDLEGDRWIVSTRDLATVIIVMDDLNRPTVVDAGALLRWAILVTDNADCFPVSERLNARVWRDRAQAALDER